MRLPCVSAQDHRRRSNRGLLTYEHFKAMGEKQHEGPRLFLNLARGFLYNPDDLKRAVNDSSGSSVGSSSTPQLSRRRQAGFQHFRHFKNILGDPGCDS